MRHHLTPSASQANFNSSKNSSNGGFGNESKTRNSVILASSSSTPASAGFPFQRQGSFVSGDVAATSDNVITRMLYRARAALDAAEANERKDNNNNDMMMMNNIFGHNLLQENENDAKNNNNNNNLNDDDEDPYSLSQNKKKNNNNNNLSGGSQEHNININNNSRSNSGEVGGEKLDSIRLADDDNNNNNNTPSSLAKDNANSQTAGELSTAEKKNNTNNNDANATTSNPLLQSDASKIINQPFSIRIEGNDIEDTKAADTIIKVCLKRDAYKGKDIDKGGLEPHLYWGNDDQQQQQAALSKIDVMMVDGVYHFDGMETRPVAWSQYIADLTSLFNLLEVGVWLSLAKTRLVALEEKYELFSLLNADLEEVFDTHFGGGGVFGRSMKVDNAVRFSTCATSDVLVENIRVASRLRAADVVHIDQHGEPMTLRDLTEEIGIDASRVTAEGLGLHPPTRKEASKRYDVLDPDMNPAGSDGVELLSLFLEVHGTNNGRFFADLVRPILERREVASSQTAATINIAGEYKLPILGMRMDEWSSVARWITDHSFTQMRRCMFTVEIPRVERKRPEYDCRTNEDQIRNIFYPMFMATLRPTDPEYYAIAVALSKVGAICVSSDEKLRRTTFSSDPRPPGTINWNVIPDDYYFYYYIWANLCSLNALRRKFGLNTFQFRTVCSEETPHWDQLVFSFLLADVVEQGGRISQSWPLQYLYYMARIGMTMSPISSNGTGVSIFESPFAALFKRGLMVSLSTADPLHYHHNSEPVLEEYGSAQSIFKLSTSDISELTRNSVLMSTFPSDHKANWLGATWSQGADGNDASKSHVSDVRLQFRHECLLQEQATLNLASSLGKQPLSINWARPLVNSNQGGQYLNPLVAKLREMQRMNAIDRRIPLNRIVIDGPAVDAQTVRSHANMLRGTITLRGRYQLHSDPSLTENLLKDKHSSTKYSAGIEKQNSNNPFSMDGGNNLPNQYQSISPLGTHGAASVSRSPGSPASPFTGSNSPTTNNNNISKDPGFSTSSGTNIPFVKEHQNSIWFDGVNVQTALQRHQSYGNVSTISVLGGGDDSSILHDDPSFGGGGVGGGASSFRFGGDEDGALERAFKLSDSRFDPAQYSFNMYYGVCLIHQVGTSPSWPEYIPTFEVFIQDVAYLRQLVTENSALAEFCHQRLKLLEHKFGLHLALNISKECGEVKDRELNNRDFYTAHKVDNNVQTEACMNARVLFHYFTERARNGSNDVVFERNNKPVTLRQYLTEIGVDVERLTVDELTNLLQSHQQLRALFLSPDNYMGGRYFAEITKHMLEQYKNDKYSFVENRLPIYGRSRSEWDVIASWCDRYGMVSTQSRWMARISRGYRHLHREGHVGNFGDYLDNIFIPLWEVSLNPAKYPRLHHFLTYVSGFDCEGNEQKVDMAFENTAPHEWNSPLNPPYNYYVYYLWANITALNVFRRQRGLNVFSFRPQAGESGSLDHLIGTFLVADGISHGVQLMHSPTLQYLFYITQLPVAMSPLSNTNVLPYLDHPFSHFFSRGLNVSLATNKPLFNHFTSEPLIEEYSLASKIWKLQNGDLSELARNSVKMSDFGSQWKRNALGPLFHLHSALGNEYRLSRVSDFRVAYRYETYHAELDYLDEVFAMEDLRLWITSVAAGQFGDEHYHITNTSGMNNNNNSQQQHQQQRAGSKTGSGIWARTPSLRNGVGSKAGSTKLLLAADQNNNNSNENNENLVSKGSSTTMAMDRAKSSRIPPRQLIMAAESQPVPFPRAMLPLEHEVEICQQRTGTKVFLPSAFGEMGNEKEEEEIGRAHLMAQIKKQIADMEREMQMKNMEVARMTDTQFQLATDIKTVRTKIAALASAPTTNIDASLQQTTQ